MKASSLLAVAAAASLSLSLSAQPSAPGGASPDGASSRRPGLVVGAGNFFSPIVHDLDAAVAFYRDGIGLEVQGAPGNAEDNLPLRNMFGLPEAHIRWTVARPPGMSTGVEIVEISGAGGEPLERRVQDAGAFTLIVFVRDLDATLARLKALGTPVVSSGGAPATLPFGAETARMVMVKDPDGHFVELVQPKQMPASEAPADSNVVDVRVRLTVDDVDRALRLYGDALGLKVLSSPPRSDDPVVSAALGASGAKYRFAMMQVPSSGLVFEVMDYRNIDRRRVRGGLEDPGSTRMQLRVSDVDAAVAAFERFGGRVVSTGGAPLELPVPGGSIKVAIVREPDNLFVVLIEAPPAP